MIDTTTPERPGDALDELRKADRLAKVLGALIALAGVVAIIAGVEV